VAELLGSDLARGLKAAEADRRRAEGGDNVLRQRPPEPWWWKLLRQFRELVIVILLVAAAIAIALGDWPDAAAILAIVLVNGIIGFLQEERAQAALAALQRMAAP
jgi:Ca2+-transporting ATPase